MIFLYAFEAVELEVYRFFSPFSERLRFAISIFKHQKRASCWMQRQAAAIIIVKIWDGSTTMPVSKSQEAYIRLSNVLCWTSVLRFYVHQIYLSKKVLEIWLRQTSDGPFLVCLCILILIGHYFSTVFCVVLLTPPLFAKSQKVPKFSDWQKPLNHKRAVD